MEDSQRNNPFPRNRLPEEKDNSVEVWNGANGVKLGTHDMIDTLRVRVQGSLFEIKDKIPVLSLWEKLLLNFLFYENICYHRNPCNIDLICIRLRKCYSRSAISLYISRIIWYGLMEERYHSYECKDIHIWLLTVCSSRSSRRIICTRSEIPKCITLRVQYGLMDECKVISPHNEGQGILFDSPRENILILYLWSQPT